MTQKLDEILEGELGDVTGITIASSNGFAGSAVGDTAPVITVQTTVTGILVGNGTAVATAVAGDFPTLNQNTTGNAATATYAASSGSAGTASSINGVSLASLGTGILKNTTGTGVPSIAVQADVTALLGAGSITNTMLANGAVANLSGTNTGDNAANSLYASDYRAANFVAGTNYAAPNQTMYVGTTALAINRVSGSQSLTGITSIDGNAATVTTNANLTGPITSTGNATAVASQTGTGSKFVMDTSPVLVTPNIGAATASSLGIGTLGYTPSANTTKIWYADTQNNFINAVIQNKSTGTAASSDLVCTTDAGTDSSQYIDMGINCTGWTGTSYGAAKDGYLYVDGGAASTGNLLIGTAQTGTKIKFQVGTLVNASAGILELTNTMATVGGSLKITGMASSLLYSNAGVVTAATIGPGLQFSGGTLDNGRVWSGTISSATGSTTIAMGTSAPASTDGTQIMSQAITPQSTSQKYLVSVAVTATAGTYDSAVTIALFRGTTFLCASVMNGPTIAAFISTNTNTQSLVLQYMDSPATTSAVTYSVRIGVNSGSWYVNRREAENTFGGTATGWSIEEH